MENISRLNVDSSDLYSGFDSDPPTQYKQLITVGNVYLPVNNNIA